MQISLQDSLTIPDTVVFRDLDGEVVILDLESSTYFGLDPVGARMWTLVSEHGSLSKVYEVPRGIRRGSGNLVGRFSATDRTFL